jgi:putative ABC transport system permease protein
MKAASMLRNVLKIAWRNLVHYKFFSLINIAGLSIGLAVGIRVLLWVQDEQSFDHFHQHASMIYKINAHLASGASEQVWSITPSPLALFARQSLPEVTGSVRLKPREELLLFNWWMFGLAGGGALLLGFLTICFQFIKSAVASPVKSLRTE